MGIQVDYGTFDSRFHGVTMRFSTPTAWQAFVEFIKQRAPKFEPGPTDDLTFEALAACSVTSHEVRHFHDSLLSPHGARGHKLRVQQSLNVLQLYSYIVNSPGNCVPVPLGRWCRLTADERLNALRWFPPRQDGRPWQPVPLPHISANDVAQYDAAPSRLRAPTILISAALLQQSLLEDLNLNPGSENVRSSIQPVDLYEIGGILAQLNEIHQSFGSAATDFFLGYIETHSTSHWRLLRLANRLFALAGSAPDGVVMSAMVTWCLLGSYGIDEWRACPTERFFALWAAVKSKRATLEQLDPRLLFRQWSHLTGLSTIEQALDETIHIADRLHSQSRDGAEASVGSMLEAYSDVIERVTSGYAAAVASLAGWFNSKAEKYTSVATYLNCAGELPAPWVRYAFEEMGILLPAGSDPEAYHDYLVRWAEHQGDEIIATSLVAPRAVGRYAFISRDDVADFFDLTLLAEFLIAERGRTSIEVRRVGRTFFEDSSITPLEVF